jgi:hypothetical protein
MANDPIAAQFATHGGQLDALTTALGAICETLHPSSELAGLINGRLEQWIASRLHDSDNEAYLQGFEEIRSHLAARLERVPPDGCTDPRSTG